MNRMVATREASRNQPKAGGTPDRGRIAEFNQRRHVAPEDIEKVRRLVQATGFFSADEVKIAAELVQEQLRLGPASGYHFLFWERAGMLAGYTCYGPIAGTQSSFDLYWIAIAPELQGQGIGRRLLHETEQLIWQQGGETIYVETSARRLYKPTRRFYLHMGYRLEALLKNFYGPRDHKCILAKTRPDDSPGRILS